MSEGVCIPLHDTTVTAHGKQRLIASASLYSGWDFKSSHSLATRLVGGVSIAADGLSHHLCLCFPLGPDYVTAN